PTRAAPSPASESANGRSATFQCTRRNTRVTGARKRQPKPHQRLTRNAPTRKLTDEISATTMPTTSRGTPAMGYVFRDGVPAGVQLAASVRRAGLSTSAGVTVATGFGAGGSSTSGGGTGCGGL